ncbi:hypothetical protein NPIL_495361, partial [Nephila pilipes]
MSTAAMRHDSSFEFRNMISLLHLVVYDLWDEEARSINDEAIRRIILIPCVGRWVTCDDDWDPLTESYDETLTQLYYTFTTITLFFLPAAVMIVFYLIVVCRLHGLQVPGETKSNVYQHSKKK